MSNTNFFTILLTLCITLSGYAQSPRDPFEPILPTLEDTQLLDAIIPPKAEITLTEKIFPLVSIDANSTYQQITQPNMHLLSSNGKAHVDTITNSLIITDTQERFALIETWLTQKDIPQQQVQITAHIISSSRTALQALGLEWGVHNDSATDGHHSRYNRYSSQSGQMALNVLRLGEGLLEMKLNALEKENLLSIIASPRLVASHKNPASIQQGSEIPYVTTSEKKSHVQFKDAVLGMEVTPTISRNDNVEMILKISHNSPDTALTTNPNQHLAINKQEIATSVTIKNNNTLILGGIFQQKQEKTDSGVPFLSQIPLLGNLFINKTQHVDKRVLVVFITPKLINI
ncbi:TPA: transporter [Providencia alcalifaciens]|uniref:transporter n=1 Tax=Providencia alcalifaciens TaxID=126385 RepID=UPI00029C0EF2|nr:transporter [Providencia alcalifaciens]EKT62126.1 transporter [Providencia alcalifaciens Dmel2]MTC39164.1 transporter [Providencia alcalifaciens]